MTAGLALMKGDVQVSSQVSLEQVSKSCHEALSDANHKIQD